MGDTFRLDGKSIAIVGAASGIGAAVAEGCARQGAAVFTFDVQENAAAHVRALDVRDGAAVRAAFGAVRDENGRLDVVISTPGVNVRKPLLQYRDDEFDRVVNLNLKGSFNVLRAAGEIMAAQGGGSI